MIKHNLKKKLEDLKGKWANELPEVLWAYRTTARSTTGETPFSLAYGYEAIVTVEIRVGSLRRENYNPEQNETLQWCELDFIQEKRQDSQLRVIAYQQHTTRYFNSKMKTRRFQIGDLIVRKVFHSKGTLDPSLEGPYKIARILTPSAH